MLTGTAAVVRLESALAHVNNSVGGGPGGPWVSLQTADYRGSLGLTTSHVRIRKTGLLRTHSREDATGLINFTWARRAGQTSGVGDRKAQNPPIDRNLATGVGSDTP